MKVIEVGSAERMAVVAVERDRVTLDSTHAHAPGTPLAGRLAGDGRAIEVKVRSCVRRGDGFRIEGRLVNLSRELRAALES
jgi:hypothetical protein